MTIRIDTLRNQLAATRTLLEQVGLHVADLHAVAYERHQGSNEPRVRGGERDYSLDNHGSPKAREAFRKLGEQVSSSCQDIAGSLHEAAVILKGDDRGRGASRRLISAAEHTEALAHQAERASRGEGVERWLPQPGRDAALRDIERRAKRAEKARDRLQARLDKALHRLAIANPEDPFLLELAREKEQLTREQELQRAAAGR